MKRILIALAIAAALGTTVWATEKACCAAPDSAKACVMNDSTKTCVMRDTCKVFTLQELAAFDGKEGRKGYIACDGTVYDVTNSPSWKGGKHNGAKAGTDVTKGITSSPHGKSVLKKLTVIGKLAPAGK